MSISKIKNLDPYRFIRLQLKHFSNEIQHKLINHSEVATISLSENIDSDYVEFDSNILLDIFIDIGII